MIIQSLCFYIYFLPFIFSSFFYGNEGSDHIWNFGLGSYVGSRIMILLFIIYIFQIMERKIINELPDYPQSKNYEPIKITLNSLIQKIAAVQKDKSIPNKQNYLNTFKQLSWSIGKCNPHWPAEVEETVGRLRSQLSNFESAFLNQPKEKKGGFFICGGGSSKPKQQVLQPTYKRILSYQQIFTIIGIYQDRKLKQDLVYNIFQVMQKKGLNPLQSSRSTKQQEQPIKIAPNPKQQKQDQCLNCELMKAVSVCPNGYIAKKLLKQLDDVQWIAGILYEDGKIVDKNVNKAIEYYQIGRKKKNPQAIYRLGLLNQRGIYGKPLEYLKLWEESAKLGHLESMTDLGYLYQNGLQQQGRQIIQPNSEKALQYYTKAVQKNFPRALNNLASFYYNDPKYKNENKCMDYFEKAAQAQYVKSLYNLGIIYLQGQMSVQDEEKAKRLIKRSAQKGDLQGKQQYVEMMLGDTDKCSADDLDEINMYCRQIIAEEEDNPYPYYFLGIMYEGGYGVPQQPKTAILYYNKAARYKCPQALIKLGNCFKNGFGIQQNSKDAILNYQKAAKSIPQANIYIGQMYEIGYPDLKQNYQQAFNHYYDACNHQIPQAYIHLGHMYKNGRHVQKNQNKAEEYFAKAKGSVKKNFNKLTASSQLIHSSYFRGKK